MPGAASRSRSPIRSAANRSRGTSSAEALTSVRSISAFASPTPLRRSSSTGRPTWASSAARRTSTSGRPERKGKVGPVRDDRLDSLVAGQALHELPVIHSPHPDRFGLALEVLLVGVALVEGDEVDGADPGVRKSRIDDLARLHEI